MKAVNQQSRNEERRARYKQLAAEGDKDQRNAELVAALGTETERTTVDESTVLVEVESSDDYVHSSAKTDTWNIHKKVKRTTVAPMKVSSAPGSGNESRAAKRARLKASKFKLVADEKHPNGPCGNVGCIDCNGTEEQRRARAIRLKDHKHRSPEYRAFIKRELKKIRREGSRARARQENHNA